MRLGKMVMGAIAALGLSACSSIEPIEDTDPTGQLRGFEDADKFATFARNMALLEEEQRSQWNDFALYSEAAADAEKATETEESITNNQEAGVDEGGIVKNAGEYLVVLRRGRLFTIRHGDNDLAPIGMIDVFPLGKENPGSTWYDEMLVNGDTIVVVGYSYGEFGTEVSRFKLSSDGQLSYRDTHYLRSGDYYSSSNYASRMIGDELIFYSPVPISWSNWERTLPALKPFGSDDEALPLVGHDDVLLAEPYRDGDVLLETAHTITRCDITAEEFECEAQAIIGTYNRSFYVSRDAVYVWTDTAQKSGGSSDKKVLGQLYRIPLDGGAPGAVAVSGAPNDQFSFAEDGEESVLRVLLKADGSGDAMWASEGAKPSSLALATVRLDQFTDGGSSLESDNYRVLPAPDDYGLHNRFVGRYLLYSSASYWNGAEKAKVYAVPLDGRKVEEITMPHGVSRFDVLGGDGVAIGQDADGALGFTALALNDVVTTEDTYMLPSAGEAESRSQAFFYRADPAVAGGISGTLALPVTRDMRLPGVEFVSSGSSIFFLRRNAREFSPAGELIADSLSAARDNCIASCVDWYGNARPIFMGDRIFALMGYELVEGRLRGGKINEVRRVDFTPQNAVQH